MRASAVGDFGHALPAVRDALERGVGGFILFGGRRESVLDLTSMIREVARYPILIGSDLERGAGQQFPGATVLPPPAALGALDNPEATRACGRATAEEARALGINWVLAPVADLDMEAANPIISTRSFGADPERVARHVAAWVAGCGESGVIACVKHFPGHGRTKGDSHLERPVVFATEKELRENDILPFAAAFEAGAGSVMTAHVAYPALDRSGEVATLSPPVIEGLLRSTMQFNGIVASDAIGMAGLSGSIGEGEAAIRALLAGCDVLLYPEDPAAVLAALEGAMATGRVSPGRVAASIARIERVLSASGSPGSKAADSASTARIPLPWPSSERQEWADCLAFRSITLLCGEDPRPVDPSAELFQLDDDLGGPYPTPSREVFAASLRTGRSLSPNPHAPPIVAIYSDPRAWKGRAGLSDALLERLAEIRAQSPEAMLVLFGHPRLAERLDFPRIVCAWGGDEVMQRAAARWLVHPPA